MEFKIGQYVATKNDDAKTHKVIVSILGNGVTLEWWNELGPQTEYVGKGSLEYLSDTPTPEFTSARTLWIEARNRHRNEMKKFK
jgi:hypothetical protein